MINMDLNNRYVLDNYARRDQVGVHNIFVVPPIFSVHIDSSEVQRIIVMDAGNDAIWSSGQPSYKLSFNAEYTGCVAYSALEADIEATLNSLSSICSGIDPCVTVTGQKYSVRAPNGHIYTLYFDLSSAARNDINDPGPNGLEVDTSHPDCNAFDSSGGEL